MADDPEPPSRKGPGKTLWVNPKDEFGNLADPIFVEAAFEILEELLQYRAAELQDESRALELIEKAVHAASRSRKGQNIRDAAAYLFRVLRGSRAEADGRKARADRTLGVPRAIGGSASPRGRRGNRDEAERALSTHQSNSKGVKNAT